MTVARAVFNHNPFTTTVMDPEIQALADSLRQQHPTMCAENRNALAHLYREPDKLSGIMDRMIPHEAAYISTFRTSEWEDGSPIKRKVIQRTSGIPDDPSIWVQQEGVNCNGASCDWEYHRVGTSQETVEGYMLRSGLKSDNFCLEELRDKYERTHQIATVFQMLVKQSMRMKSDFAKHVFRANSINLIPNPNQEGTIEHAHHTNPRSMEVELATGAPASMITPELLDEIMDMKTHVDATPAGTEDGSPLFLMKIGADMARQLFNIDSRFRDTMMELNPSSLIQPIYGNLNRAVKGFIIRKLMFPDRADFDPVTGRIMLVPSHVIVKKGNHEYEKVNDRWKVAPYEAVDFTDYDQLELFRLSPMGAVGQAQFELQEYDGTPRWQVRKLKEVTCRDGSTRVEQDDEGNVGYFKSRFAMGFMPCKTDTGYRLWVERANRNMFIRGGFKPVQAASVAPHVRVRLRGCCPGKDDNSLFISTDEPIPTDWIGQELKVAFNDGTRTATLIGHAPLSLDTNRYEFEFDCPTTCGCLGGPKRIIGPKPPQKIALNDESNDGCCGRTKKCEGIEGVAEVATAEVPTGYASAITIPSDAANPAVVGGTAVVDTGVRQINGVVISDDGTNVTIGFPDVVLCLNGGPVCSVTYDTAPAPRPLCYDIDLKGADICGFTDGSANLEAQVAQSVSYSNVAQNLNRALGETYFIPTDYGIRYIGAGQNGPLMLEDGTSIEPTVCTDSCNTLASDTDTGGGGDTDTGDTTGTGDGDTTTGDTDSGSTKRETDTAQATETTKSADTKGDLLP